jgi:hypothetical protein
MSADAVCMMGLTVQVAIPRGLSDLAEDVMYIVR